ncbi:cogc-3 [Pristionchus pacificus]|nr:cogc-3 [Pristionchus pacificus]
MDLESLIRDSNLLLKDAHLFGLPTEGVEDSDDGLGPSTLSIDGGEHILAEKWANIMKERWRDESLLVEKASDCVETIALRANIMRLRTMQKRMNECEERMSELSTGYSSVTSRTSSLHDACERALKNQTHLASMAEQIKANLYYFKQANLIFKKLSSGTKLSVTGQSFTSILSSIDEFLQLLRSHREWKEADVYIEKYEQCLSRAMTCIRASVLNEIEAAAMDVSRRREELSGGEGRKDGSITDEETLTLLYGVFSSRAQSVKSALSVAESRFSGVPEFEAMLSECMQVYFSTRQQLINPILEATLAQLAATQNDSSCTLTRSSSSFLLRVIDDEFRLYRQFFSMEGMDGGMETPGGMSVISSRTERIPPTPSSPSSFFWSETSSFDQFVEGLSRLLYNILRPMVIHNPHLETLTELCAILKVEMVDQRCGLMASMMEGEGMESRGGMNIGRRSFDPRGAFVRVMGELVGDIVERIVYRAEMYAQSDIASYRPSPGDLAYPEKLEMMRSIEEGQKKKTSVSEVVEEERENGEGGRKISTSSISLSTPSAVDLHCLWYPTVRRSVMVLAKLFKYIDMGVFQSIARDILISCCVSLDNASTAISVMPKKSGWSRSLDSILFVIKHLLILREQTAPYRHAAQRSDASLPTRDLSIDFSKMRSSASNLLYDRSKWFELSTNNAFLELLFQVPIQVSEPTGDSRRVIDNRLKQRCNELVSLSNTLLVKELNDFLDLAEKEAVKTGFVYKNVPSIAPKEIQAIGGRSFKNLSTNWPMIRSALNLYIGVNETESILLSPMRSLCISTWTRLHSFVSSYLSEEDQSIAAIPSLSHIHSIIRG